ncbi:MAG TPA: histidine kinase [Chloroflexota bacterium]|nr:histidine kinase [Chloroflexota bacterium]
MAHPSGIPDSGGADLSLPAGARAAATTALCDHLAKLIHDSVLQSLALAMLQADLCRRGIEAGDRELALSELSGIVPQLQAAVETLRGVIRDLQAAAQPSPSKD